MAKFNIYRIEKAREDDLIEKLESVGLSVSGTKTVGDHTLTFYLSKEPDAIDIWWTDLYAELIDADPPPKNKAYFGVCLISNATTCYAASLGKTHFYLKDYCDSDFGINLAERIADPNHLKLKNSKLFGGKRNKTIVSYQANSAFEYDSGESIQYVKTRTSDAQKWGETASFGNSAQFQLDIGPNALPRLIAKIEAALLEERRIILPRAKAISDKNVIAALDRKLVGEIQNPASAEISAAEATVSGVDFVFVDKSNYQFSLGYTRRDLEGELTLDALRTFVHDMDIDLLDKLNKIKVRAFDENDRGFTKPVKYFLDYVDDERHFLLDGKWHIFNQDYIEYLCGQVDRLITLERGVDFAKRDYTAWRDPERFFNEAREANEGYVNLDRHLSTVQQQYKIEKMDLWKDKTLFFVKMGTAQKLSYVIDQSLATINVLQNKTTQIEIEGQPIKPDKVCLWIILERQGEIQKLSDIKSLIFLMKLAEWQRQCANAVYQPIVRVS